MLELHSRVNPKEVTADPAAHGSARTWAHCARGVAVGCGMVLDWRGYHLHVSADSRGVLMHALRIATRLSGVCVRSGLPAPVRAARPPHRGYFALVQPPQHQGPRLQGCGAAPTRHGAMPTRCASAAEIKAGTLARFEHVKLDLATYEAEKIGGAPLASQGAPLMPSRASVRSRLPPARDARDG
jgi:hypothetical protein